MTAWDDVSARARRLEDSLQPFLPGAVVSMAVGSGQVNITIGANTLDMAIRDLQRMDECVKAREAGTRPIDEATIRAAAANLNDHIDRLAEIRRDAARHHDWEV